MKKIFFTTTLIVLIALGLSGCTFGLNYQKSNPKTAESVSEIEKIEPTTASDEAKKQTQLQLIN